LRIHKSIAEKEVVDDVEQRYKDIIVTPAENTTLLNKLELFDRDLQTEVESYMSRSHDELLGSIAAFASELP
jgi:hypothetical protein